MSGHRKWRRRKLPSYEDLLTEANSLSEAATRAANRGDMKESQALLARAEEIYTIAGWMQEDEHDDGH